MKAKHLPKSLVRVHSKVRDPKTPEYRQAIREFVEKMGGLEQVREALRALPAPDPTLFDNKFGMTVQVRRPPRRHPDVEDFHLAM